MAPIPVWSGNLRLSLVLVPVRMFPATSNEGAIAFRMIHEPSGQPIKYLKGIEAEDGFEEVPEEEIIKGYEHTKGHHVLIKPEELDELKFEAKHTVDMAEFVDRNEIDSRYFEKPYYLLPDGDSADEGYVVLRDALAKSKKLAIGQLIMHGRSTWSASPPTKRGLMLLILRYQDELRKSNSYFDTIDTKVDDSAVKLAVNLVEQESGKFEPEKMPNEYARAVHELVQAKIEQHAPEVEIETEKRETPKVVNIMDALKKSMSARGKSKLGDSVAKRPGKCRHAANVIASPTHRKLPAQVALVAAPNQFPAHFAAQEVCVLLAFGFRSRRRTPSKT